MVLDGLLAVRAKLSSFFIAEVSFFQSPKKSKFSSLPRMSFSIIGIESNGLFIGGKRFLVALKTIEGVPSTFMSTSRVGVKLNGQFIGLESVLVAPKTIEGIPLSLVGVSIVGIKSDSFLGGV